MSKPSALARAVQLINSKVSHDGVRSFMLSTVFNTQVKYAWTSGIVIRSLTAEKSELSIKNRFRVQNHIKGVHACAMAILAESATGTVFGMNVDDSKLPLLKSMKINYVRRAKGDLKAVASLSEEQRARIRSTDKGDITVPVLVTDEEWAWVPKKR